MKETCLRGYLGQVSAWDGTLNFPLPLLHRAQRHV